MQRHNIRLKGGTFLLCSAFQAVVLYFCTTAGNATLAYGYENWAFQAFSTRDSH